MTARKPLLAEIADRAASHPSIEAAVAAAVRATLPRVIEMILQEIASGETLRFYVPKQGANARKQRDERISAAIAEGEPLDSIAKREAITKRHVRNIRARFGGTG